MVRIDYQTPGKIFVEDRERDLHPIKGVTTNVAGFVGFTEDIRNGAQLGTSMLVTSWSHYLHYFAYSDSDGFTEFDAYLPFAVYGFFLNGGRRCYVNSIGTHLSQQLNLDTVVEIPSRGQNQPSLRLSLKNQRKNLPTSTSLTVEIQDSTLKASSADTDTELSEDTEFFKISVKQGNEIVESYDHLTMNPQVNPQVGDYVVDRLEKSQMLQVTDISQVEKPLVRKPTTSTYKLFVGFTEDIYNGAKLFQPILVTSWSHYLDYFGRPDSYDDIYKFDLQYVKFNESKAYLPCAVYNFFLNGGERCWICSLGTYLLQEQPTPDTVVEIFSREKNQPSLLLSLKNQGENLPTLTPLTVKIQDNTLKASSVDTESERRDDTEFFRVSVKQGDEINESYRSIANYQANLGDYVVLVTREEQSQISMFQLTDISQRSSFDRKPATGAYEFNLLPAVSRPEDLFQNIIGSRNERTGIQGMLEIDEINILAFPDLMKIYQEGLMSLDRIHDIMEAQLSWYDECMYRTNNRMVVFDTPPDKAKPQDVAQWLVDSKLRSMFGTLYYPWIQVTNSRNGQIISVPPCGHVMGLLARNDEISGVHKPPYEEVVDGVIDLARNIDFHGQELLYSQGINCIRHFPERGIRIWGNRTLAEPEDSSWRHINVRRLISYIEKSIMEGIQWAIFEPNGPDTWHRLEKSISDFLRHLWREGALTGSSAEEAFFVVCDDRNNTSETVNAGCLRIEVGVAPVHPNEFIILNFEQGILMNSPTPNFEHPCCKI